MTCIADANVLFPLLVQGHAAYGVAKAWWNEQPDTTVGTCLLTRLAVLRLLTNRVAMNGAPVSPDDRSLHGQGDAEPLEASASFRGARDGTPVSGSPNWLSSSRLPVSKRGGPAAINFAIEHPDRVASLCILKLNALSGAIAQSPQQFAWLLTWQQKGFRNHLPASLQMHFDTVTAPLIADNFTRQPSSGPAFVQLAADFLEELTRNTARLPQLKTVDIPVKVIWGEFDPYITAEVAKDRVSHFGYGSLHLLPAGHWVDSDLPEQVAQQMLS